MTPGSFALAEGLAGVTAAQLGAGLTSADAIAGEGLSADSAAQAPALDWHVVLQPDGSLDGVIAWNNMQSLAHALGSLNAQSRTFQMTVLEVGGQGRTATINGTVRQDGYLVANISGPNVNCQGVIVGWFVTIQK
jgi:acyl-homoserine lactone acylase PvdQ